MKFVYRIVSILIGYLFGLIQTAYFYSKSKGVDIRTVGSGNAGSTNVARALGNNSGLIVFACDVAKCCAAVLVCRLLFADSPAEARLITMYAGVGCTLGHDFPFYMNYRGGKGIACLAGVAFMFSVPVWAATWLTFIVVHLASHYVSLGSLCGSAVFFISVVISAVTGAFGLNTDHGIEVCAAAFLLAALAFWQHRTNIGRLIKGTESKKGAFIGKN